MSNNKIDDIELVYKRTNDTIIHLQQVSFMDLLNELEKISVDFVDLSGLKNYIFMTYPNEYNYIIHNIINNQETYTFQYRKINRQKAQNEENPQNDITFENIPNAIFRPDEIYDFEVNITQKKFKKLNQYTIIDISDIVNNINNINNINKKESDTDSNKGKKKSLLHKLFGC